MFLTGPSGAGKTTLMRLLFAAEQPSEGQIVVLGRNIARLRASAIPALAASRRRRVPGLQAAAAAHGRGERRGRARGGGHAAARCARAKVFAVLKQLGLQHRRYPPSALALGRRAAARRARARAGERARDPAGRRADRQSRSRSHARDHGPDRERGDARHDGDGRDARARDRRAATASARCGSKPAASPRIAPRAGGARDAAC